MQKNCYGTINFSQKCINYTACFERCRKGTTIFEIGSTTVVLNLHPPSARFIPVANMLRGCDLFLACPTELNHLQVQSVAAACSSRVLNHLLVKSAAASCSSMVLNHLQVQSAAAAFSSRVLNHLQV